MADPETALLSEILGKTRRKLLDTTRRNRLLNFKEAVRDIAIVDEMPDQVFSALVEDQKPFYFDPLPEVDKGDDEEDIAGRDLPLSISSDQHVASRYTDDRLQTPFRQIELEKRLRRLYRDHRTIIEETGANSLFLAVGFLEWTEEAEGATRQRSPLMLLPVRLEREGGAGSAIYKLHFDDEALDTNYSLVEKLKANFEITLPPVSDEQPPESYWQEVEATVETKPEWRVAREMVLGLFSFNKQIMWHDLDPSRWPAHSQLLDKSVLGRILLGVKPGETPPGQLMDEYSPDDEEENPLAQRIKLIRDADSSQFSALIDALTLDTGGLVIEGPPGTGKSQTITNLIASAMAEGKSVLFVAEKMAALEVVYKRLAEAGLGDYCLQLHGLKTSKKELLDSVRDRLSLRISPVRELDAASQKLGQSKEGLLAYSAALNQIVGPESLELHRVPWRLELYRQSLPQDYEPLPITNAGEMTLEVFEWGRARLDDLGKEWADIPAAARRAWHGFLPEKVGRRSENKVASSVEATVSALDALSGWFVEKSDPLLADVDEIHRLVQIGGRSEDELLPTLPRDVSDGLLHSVLHEDLSEALKETISYLSELRSLAEAVHSVFDYASNESDRYAALISENIQSLSGVSVRQDVSIGALEEEAALHAEVVGSLESVNGYAEPILDIVGGFARRVEDYEKLVEEAERLTDGPDALSLHGTELHVRNAAANYLSTAQGANADLVKRAEKLDLFDLKRTEDTTAVVSACGVVETYTEKTFRIFSSDYRHARKLLKQTLRKSSDYSTDGSFVQTLRALSEFCEDRDAFKSNADYQAALGNLFLGMETDWATLTSIVKFTQNAKEAWGADLATKIVSDWDEHCESIETARRELQKCGSKIRTFESEHPYPDSLWLRPVADIAASLKPASERVRSAADTLCQPWCAPNVSLATAMELVDQYKKAKHIERRIEAMPSFDKLIGDRWQGAETQFSYLASAQEWLQQALSAKGSGLDLLKWLVQKDTLNAEGLAELLRLSGDVRKAIWRQLETLNKLGELSQRDWLGRSKSKASEYASRQRMCLDTIGQLEPLARWRTTYQQVVDAGYQAIADQVSAGVLLGAACATAFEYSVYSAILQEKVRSDPLLEGFGRTSHENLQIRFAEQDRGMMSLNAQQIASDIARAPVPEGTGYGRVSEYTEKRLLEHEANKKTRHVPIRQLMRRAGNALQSLKPCYLMSPLSVAQYLPPGEIEFDLVVMDEASQMRPEDALGAIARARTAIIVGDPKQLPPTSFFDTTQAEEEEEEETAIDDTESILDVCLKQFPYRRLRWHYRSQHEALIQFSNEQFYDGDLIVFPSPKGDAREYGVHYNYVESPNYKKGRNQAEAELVVRHIVEHFRRTPKTSLGVAAFNKKQAEEIQLLLDGARSRYPDVDQLLSESEQTGEPFFVKNLENVQGDERDVIFISTTYGPESAGERVAQRFGPVNADVGWRRLNVIATRAKQRVEVFSSMKPVDVLIGENARRGPRALRGYLEYATTGRVTEHGLETGGSPDSEFEIAVGKVIEDLGFEWVPQVGVAGFHIDIGVRHPDRPGEYLFGVECDGATYHSSRSVRDRDRLRQEILESKGWYIHRIWSTSWFHTRQAEIDRLKATLDEQLRLDREHHPAIEKAVAEPVLEELDLGPQETESDVEELIENVLERFWHANIQPIYRDRSRSILSKRMIDVLKLSRPTNTDEWHAAINMEMRQQLEAGEMQFLPDVLEILEEFI